MVALETIFIGLERRRFALPQKFVSLHSIDLEAAAAAAAANTGSLPGVVVSGACGGGRGQAKQSSIGFFYPPQLQEGKFTITHTYKLVYQLHLQSADDMSIEHAQNSRRRY